MKNEKALNVMEYLDSSMIDEADTYHGKKSNTWIKWGAVAACLCICIAGVTKLYPALQNADKGAETGHGVEEYSGPVSGGVNFGYVEGPAKENAEMEFASNVKMMISHFDKSLNGDDMAVNNGHYELSNSLKAALSEYGSTVRYRVVVEVFKDGTVIDSGSSEVAMEEARLAKEKYTVAHETYEDTMQVEDYFTIHAEEDQLLNFAVSNSYGYYISLYDEYLGLEKPSEDTMMFSAPSKVADAPVDESDASFMHATEYPAEVLEIQQAISDAMACGDIPYVSMSCICENPLRIEVYVNTADEKLIEKIKSSYDPAGKYLVVMQGEATAQEDVEVLKGGAYVGN